MDLATLIGLLGAFAIVAGAIMMGSSALLFVNLPGLLIVIGGTVMATLMKFPLDRFFGAFTVAAKAFSAKSEPPEMLIANMVELSAMARKGGLLSLEKAKIEHPFLAEGIRMCADGYEAGLVRKILAQKLQTSTERHDVGQKIFRAIGDVAPAMGMIGTLIGLVQMMASMEDPKTIGPAMAVALLTTLYGAVIANLVALPIADKLAIRSDEERLSRSLIIEGIAAIQDGMNPRVLENLLRTYAPKQKGGKAK